VTGIAEQNWTAYCITRLPFNLQKCWKDQEILKWT